MLFYNIMGDVLLVLFTHSVFLPENSRKKHTNCVQETRNIAADGFCFSGFFFLPPSHTLLSFIFLNTNPVSRVDAAGSACQGLLFAPSSQSWVELKVFLCSPGWELRLGLTSHPSEATLRKPDFLLRCRRLPFTGWESPPGLLFFCASCS